MPSHSRGDLAAVPTAVRADSPDGPPPQSDGVRRVEIGGLALPGLLVVVTGLVLAPLQGGYAPSTWYAAGIFLLLLAVLTCVLAPSQAHERSSLLSVAIVALGGLAAWSLASIAWADDPGAAWEGGNRALVYTVAALLLGLRPWKRPLAGLALGAIGVGLALVAAAVLTATALVDEPSELFLEGRLAAPIDYANATASLWLIGLFPCLWLAIAPAMPWAARAVGQAGATLLLQMALLSQSRGAVLALVTATVVFLVLAPWRGTALVALGSAVILTGLGFDTLTDVRSATTIADQADALGEARSFMIVSCLVAAAAAALAGALLPRLPAPGRGPAGRRAGNAAVVALAVAAIGSGAIAIGSPGPWLEARWQDFKSSGYEEVDDGRTRFGGSLGSSRYDFWRVSLNMFKDRPLTGSGADNFTAPYLRERRSDESPIHPHSLAFRLLGQLGIVGTALFLVFLTAGIVVVARTWRRSSDRGRVLTAAGLAGFTAWFVHALVDWLWAFPALVVLALTMLFVSARLEDDGAKPPPAAAGPGDAPSPVLRVALGALALLAIVSLSAPGLSARFTSAAYDDAADAPARTLARLDRASQLDRLSAEPLIAKGIIARRLGRPDVARSALAEATDREPGNWFAHFEVALTAGQAGRGAEAAAAVARAAELNPRQQVIRDLATALRSGRPIQPSAFEHTLVVQQDSRLKPIE